MSQGRTNTEIAEMLDTTPQSVGRWRRTYQKQGDAGLAAKPAPGRPPRLSARQKQRLAVRLLKGARANGFATDLWTCPRIVELIARRYGVRYHVDHIPRLMASLGFSCQKPERQAAERDEEAIRQWIRVDWSGIKKRRSQACSPDLH